MSVSHPTQSDIDGMAWWNSIPEEDRALWCSLAGSARPVDAWLAYRLVDAQIESEELAGAASLD